MDRPLFVFTLSLVACKESMASFAAGQRVCRVWTNHMIHASRQSDKLPTWDPMVFLAHSRHDQALDRVSTIHVLQNILSQGLQTRTTSWRILPLAQPLIFRLRLNTQECIKQLDFAKWKEVESGQEDPCQTVSNLVKLWTPDGDHPTQLMQVLLQKGLFLKQFHWCQYCYILQ